MAAASREAEARAASILVEAESRLATERARAAQLEGSAADARCEKEAALAANELLGERLRAAAEAETGAVALARRKYDEVAQSVAAAKEELRAEELARQAAEACLASAQAAALADGRAQAEAIAQLSERLAGSEERAAEAEERQNPARRTSAKHTRL